MDRGTGVTSVWLVTCEPDEAPLSSPAFLLCRPLASPPQATSEELRVCELENVLGVSGGGADGQIGVG
jgi:hypothetical protein